MDNRLGMNSSQKCKQVEKGFLYMIVLQGNSIINKGSINLCIFVYRCEVYLPVISLESRDFKYIR